MSRSKNTFNFVLLGIILLLVLIILLSNNTSSLSRLEPVLSKKIKTYQDLIKDYSSIPKTPGGIPKLIIKISWQKLNNLPSEIKNVLNITLRLNPDYRVYYFDHDDANEFIKSSYGSKEYSAYNKLVPGAFKADLFRYCILYKYGGCYSDIGHVMLKSFDSIIEDNELVIVKDKPEIKYHGILNSLICVTPSNKFIKQLVDKSVENIENNYYGENPLAITGPDMMGKVYQCYYFNYCDNKLDEKYLMKKEGIKILEHVLITGKNLEDNTNLPEDIRETFLYITDNGIPVLKKKFDNYKEVMYSSTNKKHYGELWHNRQVYTTI